MLSIYLLLIQLLLWLGLGMLLGELDMHHRARLGEWEVYVIAKMEQVFSVCLAGNSSLMDAKLMLHNDGACIIHANDS